MASWDVPCTPHEKLVLLSIATHANKEAVCWPSVDTISRKTGMSRRSVQDQIKTLESQGFIQTEKEPGRVTHYTLKIPTEPMQPLHGDPGNGCTPTTQATVALPQATAAPHPGNGCLPPRQPLHPKGKERSLKGKKKTSRQPSRPPAVPTELILSSELESLGAKAALKSDKESSDHQDLIELWMSTYEAHFEERYIFADGRDGKAVKALLRTGRTPHEIMAVVNRAWSGAVKSSFLAGKARTLHGCAEHWGEIQADIDGAKPGTVSRINPSTKPSNAAQPAPDAKAPATDEKEVDDFGRTKAEQEEFFRKLGAKIEADKKAREAKAERLRLHIEAKKKAEEEKDAKEYAEEMAYQESLRRKAAISSDNKVPLNGFDTLKQAC